jgi:hypothetical protein
MRGPGEAIDLRYKPDIGVKVQMTEVYNQIRIYLIEHPIYNIGGIGPSSKPADITS